MVFWFINAGGSVFIIDLSCGLIGERCLVYCTKCGSPLKDDDAFCRICGARAVRVTSEEFTVSGGDLVDRVKELLHEGNVTRVIVKDEAGKTLLEIPATVGVVGVILAPWLAALGVVAALVANCHLVVERRE
jgi:hypothetical protein